jgi:crotonobetainyl-CoA:carnitine CoA-transferase CaiB-like acyl-CoA transferase
VLSRYRVIDLADDRGIFCGRVLGDLGADVVKVEPPSGDPARRFGPFFNDDPGPENSLFWQAYATNRRGVTLDIEQAPGRGLLLTLAGSADFLVESFRPGFLDSLGLGYEDLRTVNPHLIYVSITPFGHDGPYRDYIATDLTGNALGGFMYLTGDADRPPVRVSIPQFWSLGGAAAAAGAMIALHQRMLTGRGQHVDVSCQQAMARTLAHAPQFWFMEGTVLERSGPFREVGGGRKMRVNWECTDGYVNFLQPGGKTGGGTMKALCRWMEEEGFGESLLNATDFGEFGFGQMPDDILEAMHQGLGRFFLARSKRYLAEGALERRILLYPVNDASDVLEYPQLVARGFFREMEAPDGSAMNVPGPWIRSSAGPLGAARRAPRIGEHNDEVYGALGLTPEDLKGLRHDGVI